MFVSNMMNFSCIISLAALANILGSCDNLLSFVFPFLGPKVNCVLLTPLGDSFRLAHVPDRIVMSIASFPISILQLGIIIRKRINLLRSEFRFLSCLSNCSSACLALRLNLKYRSFDVLSQFRGWMFANGGSVRRENGFAIDFQRG